MENDPFERAVRQILTRDRRYPAEAYRLMPAVLDWTFRHAVQQHARGATRGHVSGKQLAEGFRDYLLAEYGPFAAPLLKQLNITSTADIGELVYNLISVNVFGKSENDRQSDFANVYDFADAFEAPYLPQHEQPGE